MRDHITTTHQTHITTITKEIITPHHHPCILLHATMDLVNFILQSSYLCTQAEGPVIHVQSRYNLSHNHNALHSMPPRIFFDNILLSFRSCHWWLSDHTTTHQTITTTTKKIIKIRSTNHSIITRTCLCIYLTCISSVLTTFPPRTFTQDTDATQWQLIIW